MIGFLHYLVIITKVKLRILTNEDDNFLTIDYFNSSAALLDLALDTLIDNELVKPECLNDLPLKLLDKKIEQ